MDIAGYLEQVRHAYESGHATEHSYRPALHALFQSIDPALTVVNEPKKSEGGMPDFLFNRGDESAHFVPIAQPEISAHDFPHVHYLFS
jgi:hypothetical protein